MSNAGDPDIDEALARAVEIDHTTSPTKGRSTEPLKGNHTKKDVRRNKAGELNSNPDPHPSPSIGNSPTALHSSVNMSEPYSRSSSPAEETYKSFRSPINDSRGYYANALRRHEAGSDSTGQDRRVAPRRTPSPPFLPRTIHINNDASIRRASSGPYASREQDAMEVDEPTPHRFSSPRFPAYENVNSATNSPEPADRRGQSIQRKSVADRTKLPQPDPYVGIDDDAEHWGQYDSYDEGDDQAYGAREEYTSSSRMGEPSGRRESQVPQVYRPGLLVEDSRDSSGQRYQGYASRSRRPGKADEGFNQTRKSQNDALPPPRRSIINDEEEELFVPAESRQVKSSRKQAGASSGGRGGGGRPQQMFSHDTFITDAPDLSTRPASKKRKLTEEGGQFNQPGAALAPSRYSGDPSLNWGLNQDPRTVPQTSVSDAALLKRGLSRGAKEKVCKRGYGANDPENVNIVNMKEDGMSFAEIVEQLNEVRVSVGRAPSLSVCGVTSRYNRTAPLLFAASGRQFIPLSKRGKGDVLADGPLAEKPVWNDRLDFILAQCVKDIDKEKWGRVATEFNNRTGKNVDAAAAALRHTLL